MSGENGVCTATGNLLRKLLLYPTELRGHVSSVIFQLKQNRTENLPDIQAISAILIRVTANTRGKHGKFLGVGHAL